MIILGQVSEIEDESRLSIAWFSRVPLGLKRDTTVYLVLLPEPIGVHAHRMAEVVLTPINPSSWRDLWRIRCRLSERPGVIANFLRALQKHNINILFQETATIQRNKIHAISTIADLRGYAFEGSDTLVRASQEDIYTLPSLEKLLALEILEDMIMIDEQPAIVVERMQNFYEAYIPFERHQKPFNPTVIAVGNYGEIKIDQPEFINAIKDQLWLNDKNPKNQNVKLRYAILNSHTEDRYISMLFPSPNHILQGYEVVHREKVGALATISRVIKNLNINIISSFNRLQKMGTEATWTIILDIQDLDPQHVANEIKSKVNEIEAGLIYTIRLQQINTINDRHTL